MVKIKNKTMKRIGLEDIIRARLKMQAVQKNISMNFGVKNPEFEIIIHPNFLKKFDSWDKDKKKNFLYSIAGPVNMARTFRYFEDLRAKYNTPNEQNK